MSESYNKLISTLQTIFEMDKADLDFGIYRIMNQKRDEINRFLEQDLLPQVKQAFAEYSNDGNQGAQAELGKLIQTLSDAGMDPEQSPKVVELRQQLASAVDVTALENDVFSKLHTFLSRYYDKGDFISQRRYKADTYAIPYEGEEVKLYWANHDQYYIKSSEHLRDYAFITKDIQDNDKPVRIKLVEADTEKDNVKAKSGEERRFVLDEQTPLSIEDGELLIHFNFIPVGKKKQTDLNKAAVETIFKQAAAEFSDWLALLKTPAPTEKDAKRTILEKHLNDYTARNTFDYFIHKDLGGFLNRELDFYIKNEVMHLDDIDDASFELTQQQLRKIKILRSIAQKIIRMLAQIENFQKKMWLKKKFVVETNYCITLDRVPEYLYHEIAANEWQINEWVSLFAIDELDGFSKPLSIGFLKGNDKLVLDTRNFNKELKESLIKSIDQIDEQCDGVVIKSDNFQAINLCKDRYNKKAKTIYIDPPYNTEGDDFLYKDGFKDSSWASFIIDRIGIADQLTNDDTTLFVSLDDRESPVLRSVANICGWSRLGEFVWKTRNTDNRVVTRFSVDHESVHVFCRTGGSLEGRTIDRSNFKNRDNDPRGPYTTDPLTGKANFQQRPNLHYTITNPDTGDVYPPDPDFGWITDKAGFDSLFKNNEVFWPANPQKGKPRKKRFLKDASPKAPISSMGISIKQGEGNQGLSDLMGYKAFNFPKPVSVISSLIDASTQNDGVVIDFFAGTGTTAHSVINTNRIDEGKRKYLLVESGWYFDSILIPRIKKAAYSDSWEKGKPINTDNGISHTFKIIELEGYEDVLNNLNIISSHQHEVTLRDSTSLHEDYMLGYWLDVETADSPSLLNIEQFEDPFNYKLNIGSGSVGATTPTTVDLVETFNYLIGLTVKTMDVIRGFKIVTGTNPKGETVLVVWRNLKEKDNASLEEFLDKQGYNPRDTEFEHIYVNGDHTLEDPQSKVKMTEMEFKRLMFDVKDV